MRNKRCVLVINQHGENRGDESALRGMIRGIEKAANESFHFVVVAQHRDRKLPLSFQEEVDVVSMVMPIWQAIIFLAYLPILLLGLPFDRILPKPLRVVTEAYRSAVIVISAPGGPYFGDLYRSHEIVHWFYVWLAAVKNKKVVLYSPSAGPFKSRVLNPIRRWLYPKFKLVSVREERSKEYLASLLPNLTVEVAADAALQDHVPEVELNDVIPEVSPDSPCIAVSILDYAFRGEPDPEMRKRAYLDALEQLIRYVHSKHENATFLFLPQLYGSFHSDRVFIKQFLNRFDNINGIVVRGEFDSDIQRGLIQQCHLCIASRYHPQVWSVAAGVPFIGVAYEHKQIGLMRLVGLEEYLVGIRHVSGDILIEMFDRLSQASERSRVLEILKEASLHLKNRAYLASELTVRLMNS